MRILLVGGPLTGHLHDVSADMVARGDLKVLYLPDSRRIDVKTISYQRTLAVTHGIPIFKARTEEPRKIIKDHFDSEANLFYASENAVYHGHAPILKINDSVLSQGAVSYLAGKIARGLATGSLFHQEKRSLW